MKTEQLIIKNLLNNHVYSQKVLPYLKDEYFKDSDLIAFRLIREYTIKYGKQPSKDELLVSIPQVRGYTDDLIKTTLKEIESLDLAEITTNVDWLVDKTEQFCSDRAIENAIRESISILNSGGKKNRDIIPDLLSEALGITFDPSIGHDYLEDYEERYDLLHNPVRRIPFDLDMLNRITKNGLPPKTLNVIVGGINVGKAQPLSTPIPTPTGWKLFGDLKIGDVVFGSDGKEINVTGIFPQGGKDVYKITFRDGRSTECCGEHLWSVFDGTKQGDIWKKRDIFNWSIVTTKEIMTRLISNKNAKNQLFIPLTQPVNYPKKDLKIHPYILGVLLGGGHLPHNEITNTDDDVLHKINSLLPKDHFLSTKKDSITHCITVKRNEKLWEQEGITRRKWYRNGNKVKQNLIRVFLRDYNLSNCRSWDKFIPEDYQYSSVEDRIELLQGLMDSDGYISKNGSCALNTASLKLANQLCLLVRSLGGLSKIHHKKNKFYKYQGIKVPARDSFCVYIRMPKDFPNIFSCQKKCERYERLTNKFERKLRIKSIEHIGQKECQCISVSAPNKLYLTENYIVTHNTLCMCHMAAANLAAGKNVLYITLEMAEEEIASRIDANLLDIALDDLSVVDKHVFTGKIKDLKTKALGKLVIKEYPTSGANVIHFKSLLNELMIKKDFRPDIIYIDYINICGCASMKFNGDTYNYVKAISQELRGWAVEEQLPIVSGTQLTRKGFGSSQPGMDDTSESFALPATVDFMIAIVTSPELDQLGQYMVFQLKNRYGNKKKNAAFVIGVDMDKQRLYNVTQPGGQQQPVSPPPLPSIIVQQPGGLANKFQGIKI
jgi:replicative DNA helicase